MLPLHYIDQYIIIVMPQSHLQISGIEDGYIAYYQELGGEVLGLGYTQTQAIEDLKDIALSKYNQVPIEEMPVPKNKTIINEVIQYLLDGDSNIFLKLAEELDVITLSSLHNLRIKYKPKYAKEVP